MEKRGKTPKLLKVFVSIVIAIVLLQTAFYFFISKPSSIENNSQTITGKVSFEIDENLIQLSPAEKTFLGIEWGVVVIIVLVILIRGRIKMHQTDKKDHMVEKMNIRRLKKAKQETDLDLLYRILKANKELKLKTIAKLFSINKETALNWCKILEEGDLAILDYPTFGDPKLVINQEEKDEDEEKAKEKNS